MWLDVFYFYTVKEWRLTRYQAWESRQNCGDAWWVQFMGYSLTSIINFVFQRRNHAELGMTKKRTYLVQNQQNSFFFYRVSIFGQIQTPWYQNFYLWWGYQNLPHWIYIPILISNCIILSPTLRSIMLASYKQANSWKWSSLPAAVWKHRE